MAKMTRRERVYAAINHKEPDRVPISFNGTYCSGITESLPNGPALSRLYEFLGIKDAEQPKIGAAFNIVTNVDMRLIDRLHSDMVVVSENAPSETVTIEPDGVTKKISCLCGMRIRRVGPFDEPVDYPMRYMQSEKDVDEYPWPDPVDIMRGVVEKARFLHEETDYFVTGDTFATFFPFNGYPYLRGMQEWLTDIKIRPKFYHKLCQRFLEFSFANIDQFFGGIGKYLDAAVIYDDLGSQVGPMFSLTDYREFIKPYTKAIIDRIRKHIRLESKIIHHSCGSVFNFIRDDIENGVDVLQAVQPLAKNMEPWRLKEEYGKDITFMGGWDLQKLLPLGTPKQNREGVKKLIQEYAPGGGYIFSPAHNIEPETPPENVVAGYDVAYEYGKYPIPKPSGQTYIEFIRDIE